MYNSDEFLQLSGIQHFVFCKRQWALIHIEQQWQENVRTVEGHLLHKRAHDGSIKEKRGDMMVVRALPVHSEVLGISGECDVVEFYRSKAGISIFGWEDKYEIVPVEYKRGKPKSNPADMIQLALQAICLEEMLCCSIDEGAIFYGETRRRERIELTEALKGEALRVCDEMHKYYRQQYTPKVKKGKECKSCSLREICLPKLNKNLSVKDYLDCHMSERSSD